MTFIDSFSIFDQSMSFTGSKLYGTRGAVVLRNFASAAVQMFVSTKI